MAPIMTPQPQMVVTPMGAAVQQQQVVQPGGASISLEVLLDFLIQKTYHDLTVLAELLPRRVEMERKIEIVKFARSTRQSFIRLLALVKWASSAAKVDKCAAISQFLDQQSLLFVDTADMLSRMSRDILVNARLPNFCLPHAVDVLTVGQYKRLPTCIKERIIPPDPITPSEKATVLNRLDQIIQHRLVTSELPPQLSSLTIADGRVKFHVPQEFEATLTLMEDNPSIPWRLLHIKILVTDPETGNGKNLVHPLQVNYIHQLVQSQLFGEEKPLRDMYTCLHTFCQSLQLEVLHSQVMRLIKDRWSEHITVEKYLVGQSLTLLYWRAQNFNSMPKKQSQYKITVSINNSDVAKPLHVVHTPPLEPEDAKRVGQAIRCERLSIERLLVETILVRSKMKLQHLQESLAKSMEPVKATVKGVPSLLYIPVLESGNKMENITVSIDLQTGMFEPYGKYCDDAMLDDIEMSLQSDLSKLPNLLTKIRLVHCMEVCKKSLQTVPVTCSDSIPLIPLEPEHPLAKLSQTKLFVALRKHKSYYVVVEFSANKEDTEKLIKIRYFLLRVRKAFSHEISALPQPSSDRAGLDTQEVASFLSPTSLVQLDKDAILYGPGTPVDDSLSCGGKKRRLSHEDGPTKRSKHSTPEDHTERDLLHIIALCGSRIPFILLCEKFSKEQIPHQGVQPDVGNTGLVVKLCQLPPCPSVSKETNDALSSALLSCSIRLLHKKSTSFWQVQLILCQCPVMSSAVKEQEPAHEVYFTYEVPSQDSVVDLFLQDWEAIAHLYQLVMGLPDVLPYVTLPSASRGSWLQEHSLAYSILIDIVSYTYKKITIAYNKDKSHVVTIWWDTAKKEFKLAFSALGSHATTNCHGLLAHNLQQELNEHKMLARLMMILCITQAPLQAICKLPLMPVLRSVTNGPASSTFSFVHLAQSSTHFRLVFRNHYCLDILCKGKKAISIRDGAHSLFDMWKSVGYQPAVDLKAFLEMFVDDMSLMRRRTITDDDPSSPMSMETMSDQGYHSGQQPNASPMPGTRMTGQQGNAAGFIHPVPSPAKPASPHTSMLSQAQQYSMSPGAYPLASPPNMPAPSPGVIRGGVPSPAIATGSPGHLVPSPGSFVHTPSPSIQMPSPATGPFISPQGMGDATGGSPYPGTVGYPAQSPGHRNWPASPSVPGPSPVQRFVQSPGSAGGGVSMQSPGSSGLSQSSGMGRLSRTLSHRPASAALPTILSHDGLHKLCTAAPLQGINLSQSSNLCSPLERFLGAIYLKAHLTRTLQVMSEGLQVMAKEHGSIQFRSEYLQFKIALHIPSMQYLQLHVKPVSEEKERYWTQDELKVLERYFEMKVACAPFKCSALTAFLRLLHAPQHVMHDIIALLRLELFPDRKLKWLIEWCLTVHPSDVSVSLPGAPAIVIKTKILFFIKLTFIGAPPSAGQEPQSEIVPIIYEVQSNTTTDMTASSKSNINPSQNLQTISSMLKRWGEMCQNKGECTLYPAIHSLMANLVLPM